MSIVAAYLGLIWHYLVRIGFGHELAILGVIALLCVSITGFAGIFCAKHSWAKLVSFLLFITIVIIPVVELEHIETLSPIKIGHP